MHGKTRSSSKRTGARFGVLAASLGICAVIVPTAAQAGNGLVVPQSQPSAPITPHAATPAPSSAPAPALPPSPAAAPAPAPASTSAPAPSQGDTRSGYPFPEGNPNYSDPGCDVSCEQEWYAYYDEKGHEAWADADFAPNAPGFLAISNIKKEIAANIRAQDPHADPAELIDYGGNSSDNGDSSGSGNAPTVPDTSSHAAATPVAVVSVVVDAITGAGPIVPESLEPELGPTIDLGARLQNFTSLMTLGGLAVGLDIPYVQPQDGATQCSHTHEPDGHVTTCQK